MGAHGRGGSPGGRARATGDARRRILSIGGKSDGHWRRKPRARRSGATDLFTRDLTAERLDGFTDPEVRRREVAPASPEVVRDDLRTPTDERAIFYVGTPGARERIWLQCDALVDGPAQAGAVWAMLESLSGKEVSQHRHLVLGRSYLAVVGPRTSGIRGAVPVADVPPLDAGAMGASPDILQRMRRFKPTLVVHVQDWTADGSSEHPLGAGRPAGTIPPEGSLRMEGAPFRQIESYLLSPESHARLVEPGGFRFSFGRPSSATRMLESHPEARMAARAHRYVARMGFARPAAARRGESAVGALDSVVEIGRGRYIPRPEWRLLGGGNLAELALATLGSMGLTAQLLGGSPAERAGRTMAFMEGAILNRMNLDIKDSEA